MKETDSMSEELNVTMENLQTIFEEGESPYLAAEKALTLRKDLTNEEIREKMDEIKKLSSRFETITEEYSILS